MIPTGTTGMGNGFYFFGCNFGGKGDVPDTVHRARMKRDGFISCISSG